MASVRPVWWALALLAGAAVLLVWVAVVAPPGETALLNRRHNRFHRAIQSILLARRGPATGAPQPATVGGAHAHAHAPRGEVEGRAGPQHAHHNNVLRPSEAPPLDLVAQEKARLERAAQASLAAPADPRQHNALLLPATPTGGAAVAGLGQDGTNGSANLTRGHRHHLFVMHVPRTGGVSLSALLRAVARDRGLTVCGEYPRFAPYNCSSPHWHRIEPAQARLAADIVEGHLKYGVHQALTPPATAGQGRQRQREDTWNYVVTLRRPAARSLSQYKFHYAKTPLSLSEYARPERFMACNWQTAFLLGGGHSLDNTELWTLPEVYLPRLCPPYSAAHGLAVRAAMRHLDSFQTVLVLERLAPSLCLLAVRVFGKPAALCGRTMPSVNPAGGGNASSEAALQAINDLDELVYAHGLALLDTGLQQHPECRSALLRPGGAYWHPTCPPAKR